MFKPLKLPSLLHPYPVDCYEYLPWFSGENQASTERHLESFLDFVDRFQIVHEDVIMRYFSKSLIRDVALWFKGLRDDSIGSWIEFSNVFMKYWGENKSADSYLVDFYALKKQQNETLLVFNRRFCSIYYGMPLEIRPTEKDAMIYYVMGLHSELALFLLERKSSSLKILFEDALEIEENIIVSRRIREQADFENLHLLEPAECQYNSDFEQEGNDYEAVLEQQQAAETTSDCESNSSTFAEYSRNRYSCKIYDQFTKHVEPMITNDCIDNYIFKTDHDLCHSNTALSSSSENFSEEKVIVFDDHNVITKEQEVNQSSNRRTVMVEQEVSIDIQLFPEDQHVSDLCFKDPVAAFIESYISEKLKVSDFFSLHMFSGEFGFVNGFLSFLLHFKHQLLISVNDEIISVLKLLGWLLWKSTFT
jgi:hypothetical protein